jgi:hypothetical protein
MVPMHFKEIFVISNPDACPERSTELTLKSCRRIIGMRNLDEVQQDSSLRSE